MRKLTLALGAALAITSAMPVYASNAQFPGKGEICHEKSNDACAASHRGQGRPHAHEVPEIDAASAGLALALLGGIVAIRRERRNRR